ncbi:polycomb group RING finger protein 5-A-like [Stylophora pistillata]|uniref:Polycomb group RING finger protein 5-A n=1 Tax=Stylophora pistillata TaxID=50429 RepID=A0A2B4S8I9_STYPI|nr:polycomb group RING finger protein 5-A-like [Stylophora pistillata]PFX25696.1 Polycomb group RING finger protein 5-A [Stylophora pistillata]
MAVLQSNREKKLKLQDLNSFITCKLCSGYLIKPTTITECLHTFCRSCIVRYLQDRDDNKCPTCSILIHETNPFEMLRSDQTLEDVVYKLVPALQANEEEREREFYMQQSVEERKKINEEPKENGTNAFDSTDYKLASKRVKLSGDEYDSGENFHRDDPQIGVCLERLCDNSVQEQPIRELVRKYIRCSSRLTIAQVKKFLKVKLDLRTADQVEVMCNGEIMGKDHTLEFVYMTRWRIKEGSLLTLQYRPRMDFL